jgi:hypothetical protein
MAYTEFCCRSGGSNLNAGTRSGSSTEPSTTADFTYASGSWVASTGVFTVASGNPSSDGVAVGDFASVYADGATVTGFIGRVTAVSTTTITVSLTAKAGTAPVDGTGTRTVKIGGAWQGPNGASGFPFNFVTGTLTNAVGNTARVNFKDAANYNITAAMIHTVIGPVFLQGYTTSYGDFGKATISGGTSGASYVLLAVTSSGGDRTILVDLIFRNNGSTGTAAAVQVADARCILLRCVVYSVRGTGFDGVSNAVECEAFYCNQSNTALLAGFTLPASALLQRCISHHHIAGVNGNGFYTQGVNATLLDCISCNNTGYGLYSNNITSIRLINSDFYNNSQDGYRHTTAPLNTRIENCNFIDNTGYGINIFSGSARGFLHNCGFGGNGVSAKSNTGFMEEVGTVTYGFGEKPWVDPANGDFRVNSPLAKGAGRGKFTQYHAGWSAPNTLDYADIGAAQHQDMSVQPTYGIGI